jgi:hypothetical protein
MVDKQSKKIVAQKQDKPKNWSDAIDDVQRRISALRLRQAELTGVLEHFRELEKSGEPWQGDLVARAQVVGKN